MGVDSLNPSEPPFGHRYDSPIKIDLPDGKAFLDGVRALDKRDLKLMQIGSTSAEKSEKDGNRGTYQDKTMITLGKYDDIRTGGEEYKVTFNGQFPSSPFRHRVEFPPGFEEKLKALDKGLTIEEWGLTVKKNGEVVGGIETVYDSPEGGIQYGFTFRFPVADTSHADQDFMENFELGLDIYRMWVDNIYRDTKAPIPAQTIVIHPPQEIDYKNHSQSSLKKIDPMKLYVGIGGGRCLPADVYDHRTDNDQERQYVPLSPRLLDEGKIIIIEGIMQQLGFMEFNDKQVRIVIQKSPDDRKYIIYGLYIDEAGKPTGRVALRTGTMEEHYGLLDPSKDREQEEISYIGISGLDNMFNPDEVFDSQGEIKEGWGHIIPPRIGYPDERTIYAWEWPGPGVRGMQLDNGRLESAIFTFAKVDRVLVVQSSPVAANGIPGDDIIPMEFSLKR